MGLMDLPEDILNGDAGPRSSWAVGAYTGYKINKQGTHTPLGTLSAALGWRIWSAVFTWWGGIWILGTVAFIWAGIASSSLPVAIPTILFNGLVIYLAMGLSFIRLSAQSAFELHGPFKPLWRLAVRVPNVAPLWLYLLPFLPMLWGLTALKIMTLVMGVSMTR